MDQPSKLSPAARLRDEAILAMTLLTRIPMPPARAYDEKALGRAIWAYPLVGALIGAIGASVLWLAMAVGVPPMGASWVAIAATILATGCFHEDGLADFWDGIGGGHTIERKLEIMRDSRIGSYGGTALILSLGARAALLGALAAKGWGEAAMIVAGLIGRSAIAGVLLTVPPARVQGLSTTAAAPPRARALLAIAASGLAGVLVPPIATLAALAAALVATTWMIKLIKRQIEGYTGDALGASEQTVEIAVLVALSAAL